MTIENAHYTDPEHTQISAEIDGTTLSIPVDPTNRHYTLLLEEGVEIADYTAPPPPSPTWTSNEFLRRFTKAERTAVRQKAKENDDVADFVDFALAADGITPEDQDVIDGMGLLVSLGMLSQDRRDEILSY